VIQISFFSIFCVLLFSNLYAAPCEVECNRAPSAESTYFAEINQFASVSGILPASDPDSDPLTFTIVKSPVGGTLSEITSLGEFTYTTVGNFSGTDYILFKVSDGALESEVATATIQVDYINRAPTVSNIDLTAPQNVPFVYDKGLSGEDLDSDPLIYTIVFTTSHGILSAFDNTNGNFTYIPDEGYLGTDVFTYLANDGTATSSLATGTINFVLNNPPHITILGDNPLDYTGGNPYLDPGATATDTEDGDVTSSIQTYSEVNLSVVGTYTVVYRASDIFGIFGYATRTVIVSEIIRKPQEISTDLPAQTEVENSDPIHLGATSTSGLVTTYSIEGDCTLSETNELRVTGPEICILTIHQSGNDEYDSAPDVVREFKLTDKDGVDYSVEDEAPNNGDGNGDGESDSNQSNVVSAPNSSIEGEPYVTLSVEGGNATPTITNFFTTRKVNRESLGDNTIPVGGFGFSFEGEEGKTFTIKITLDKVYDTSTWKLQKTEDGTLHSGPGVSFSVVTVGGVPKTRITYLITDNDGEFDLDTRLGFITDPVYVVSSPVVSSTPTNPGSIVIPASSYSNSSNGQVLGASTGCGVYLDLGTDFLMRGKYNDPQKVILLKKFLNKELGISLQINGYFGPLTEKAVKDFQLKYKDKVLAPWGIEEPTGIVYLTTLSTINFLQCPALGYTLPIGALKPIQ
jgi:peptidoglycan hydrolase-like protein with peptidoglycan-binding domain